MAGWSAKAGSRGVTPASLPGGCGLPRALPCDDAGQGRRYLVGAVDGEVVSCAYAAPRRDTVLLQAPLADTDDG